MAKKYVVAEGVALTTKGIIYKPGKKFQKVFFPRRASRNFPLQKKL